MVELDEAVHLLVDLRDPAAELRFVDLYGPGGLGGPHYRVEGGGTVDQCFDLGDNEVVQVADDPVVIFAVGVHDELAATFGA